MNLLGYDAMVIGDMDLQLGVDVLRQRIAEAKFPVLSANLKVAASGQLLAQAYTIRSVGGRKIGIIGLTSDIALLTLGDAARRYTIAKADDVLPGLVAEVAKKTDIVVLLSNMGYEEDQRLSGLAPGIDLIVGGRSSIDLTDCWRNEQTGTIVVQASTKGGSIGRSRLVFDAKGVVTEHSCEYLTLTDAYPEDAEMRAFLDQYPKP